EPRPIFSSRYWRSRMGRAVFSASRASSRAGHNEVAIVDFANFTERARSILQGAQMEALAGRHQHVLPEHLLKALLDDGEGLAARLGREAGGGWGAAIGREAGGDPEQLKTAAEERLERLPKLPGDGPFSVYMSPEL